MRKLRIREQNQLAQAHTASKWCTAGIQSEVCLIPKFLSTSLQCQIWETWFSLEKERRDKFEMAYSLLLKFHTIKRGHVIFIFILWIFFSLYFLFYFFTLRYCIGFAIHWHESAMGVHEFPILNPPPTSLPISSLWIIALLMDIYVVSMPWLL